MSRPESGEAVLARIEAGLIEDGPRTYWLIRELKDLCCSGDPDVCRRAAAIAAEFIRRNCDVARSARDANSMSNYVLACLDGIAAVAPAGEMDLLKEILASKLLWYARGQALVRLAELEGTIGVVRLCAALAEVEYRSAAAEGLQKLARGTADAAVIEALDGALDLPGNTATITAIARAAIAVGGDLRSPLEKAVTGVAPDFAMTIRWLQHGVTPKDLAEHLSAACGGLRPTDAEMQEYEASWEDEPDAFSLLTDMLWTLGERLTGLDCKDSHPPDYPGLLETLGDITGGVFEIENVLQATAEQGQWRVSFDHRGEAFTFFVDDNGRYYDLRAVLDGLNEILARLGYRDQFFQLYTGSSAVIITFVHAEEFLRAANALHIPIELDPDTAQAAGMAYTNYVLSNR
jgi:hypothetical protein